MAYLTQPNLPQQAIDNYSDRFNCAVNSGMFKPSGGCPAFQSADAPWIIKPPQSVDFRYSDSIAVGACTPGVDTLVTTFVSRLGYDGVINSLVNQFTGLGFVEGSGSIIWRVQVGFRWVEDYAAITTTLGESDNPFIFGTGGIRFREKTPVSIFVNIPDISLFSLTDTIVCGMAGWQYRMESYSRVYA
jgi:hypothetical protein